MARASLIITMSLLLTFGAWVSGASAEPLASAGADATASTLRSPSAFAAIGDVRLRSIALFEEAGKVLQHPRCLNCHPASDQPTQTDQMHTHHPQVTRGPADAGAPGMPCSTCHHATNFDAAGVPGRAGWRLAPRPAAWVGRSLGEICTQIKDPARNGGMNLKAIVHHVSEDHFVGWAWEPGSHRTTPPGSQRELGALVQAWVDSGAACPAPASTSEAAKK